jgi:DNA-binding transcriptional ArsR family regulator
MIGQIEKIKALGDETRLRIVRILIKAGVQLCVCEIECITGKPQYAISRALGVLRNARLVAEERDGKLVKYGIVADGEFTRKLFDSVASIKCVDVPAFSHDVENIKKVLGNRDDNGKPTAWCGCN